jgi:hypothetical protein
VEPVEQPRPVRLGDAGAAVLDGQADPVALGADEYPDLSVGARVPAGVVDQDAGQPVDPLRRRADQHRAVRGLGADRGADGAEPVRAHLRQRGQVDGLVAGRRRPGVEPGQPEHVVNQLAQSPALALDPAQRVAVLGRLPRGGQGHVGLRPDHAERGAELVRGVGGELELAAPRLLHRGERPQADHEQAGEHGEQQERAGHDLAVDQKLAGVRVAGHALARDQPASPVGGQLQPERAEGGEAGGEAEPVVRRRRGQQSRGQRGRARAVLGNLSPGVR